MHSHLTIALVQANAVWENPLENQKQLTTLLERVSSKAEIVLLPEMFATGFSMNPQEFAESMQGPTVQWMQAWAANYQKVLAGSLAIEEKGLYYNRFLWVLPDGSHHTYDKRYGFSLAGEDKVYTAGTNTAVFEYRGWRICPRICYDLRFPLWARNTENYDLLLFVANWPQPRIHAWDTLLQARAIENLSYCIGVNRVGEDANGNIYPGHSAAYDALGHQMSQDLNKKEGIAEVTMELDSLRSLRKRLNFLADRDEFVWGQKLD
jgi:omega-amidase